jgi:hypothetical protein
MPRTSAISKGSTVPSPNTITVLRGRIAWRMPSS